MKNQRGIWLGVASLCLAAVGCDGPGGGGVEGEMRMGVLGSDDYGYQYRLRDAQFDIHDGEDTVVASISTEDYDPAVEQISTLVSAGAYFVELRDGWRIEMTNPHDDVVASVGASLASANPQATNIDANEAASVVFAFVVDGGGVVELDQGSADISISVDTQTHCDPLLQNCGTGRACVFAVQEFICVELSDEQPAYSPCGYINECEPGSTCVNAHLNSGCDQAQSTCCLPFCELQGDQQCDGWPSELCEPVGSTANLNSGLCIDWG